MITPLEVARDAALERFRAWLDSRGQSATPQRLAVARAVLGAPSPVSAEDVVECLRAQGPAPGVATVYRALDALVSCGLAQEENRHEGFRRFRAVRDDEPSEELLCTRCGRLTVIAGGVAAGGLASAVRAAGFIPVRHRLTVYGLCGDCALVRERGGAPAQVRSTKAGAN